MCGECRLVSSPGGSLRAVDLGGLDLTGADLREVDLTETRLVDARLRSAWLANANLTRASLLNANLQGADLSEAILDHADLRGAELLNATVRGASLHRTQIDEVWLSLLSGYKGVPCWTPSHVRDLHERGRLIRKDGAMAECRSCRAQWFTSHVMDTRQSDGPTRPTWVLICMACGDMQWVTFAPRWA